MADLENNQNGVFGGVPFENGANTNGATTGDNTSYFEGTLGNANTEKANSFGIFENPIPQNYGEDTIIKGRAIAKQSVWSKIRNFLFQEIDLNAPIVVTLTPYQQKVEKEINDFLHQEVTFKGIANLFKGNK